jgi:hypothetical protein
MLQNNLAEHQKTVLGAFLVIPPHLVVLCLRSVLGKGKKLLIFHNKTQQNGQDEFLMEIDLRT